MLSASEYKFGIVGGGISGTLLALRLSREAALVAGGIALWERMPGLGGRPFFHGYGLEKTDSAEANLAFRLDSVKKNQFSGFGFELLGSDTAQILERHIRAVLSESEQDFLDKFVAVSPDKLERKAYFVKKEITSLQHVLTSSSEILTKKEADFLSKLCSENTDLDLNVGADKGLKFGDSPLWKDSSIAQREATLPIVETFLGKNVLALPQSMVIKNLVSAINKYNSSISALFARTSALEIALEMILIERGVAVNTNQRICKLSLEKDFFTLNVANGFLRHEETAKAKKLVVSSPLVVSLGFMPRDMFASSHAKMVLKCAPQSMVALEYINCSDFLTDSAKQVFSKGTNFIFPVERVIGYVNSANNLLLYSYLGYEDSLQAPAVRESMARIRKAAARIFVESYLHGTSTQSVPKNMAQERIILIPVARYLQSPNSAFAETKMGVKNLFCCGDSLAFEDAAIGNVLTSVMNVNSQLLRGENQ